MAIRPHSGSGYFPLVRDSLYFRERLVGLLSNHILTKEGTMVLNQRKLQKKAEKRNAKQKAKKKEMALRSREDPTLRLVRAASAPILHSAFSAGMWTDGIGNVLLSRQLANGSVASAMFLVDVFCLGVKNAFFKISSRDFYQTEIYDRTHHRFGLVNLSPESLRKLVEGAVAYAGDLGIAPHPDYALARLLFGDIDASLSTDEYQYGKDGKPLFIGGPHDSPQKCGRIMDLLIRRSGQGNFDYMVPVGRDEFGNPDLQSLVFEHESEEDDEDEA
jgi:hypothetical protein